MWQPDFCYDMRNQLREVVFEVNSNWEQCAGFGKSARFLLQCTRLPVLFPAHARVLKVGLCLPVGTAGVERAFSELSLVKDKLRSRMGEDFLRVCMAVNLLTPTCGVDGLPPSFLEQAIDHFISTVDSRAQRFAPFAHYMHAVAVMRA